jgi:hypothetical protein
MNQKHDQKIEFNNYKRIQLKLYGCENFQLSNRKEYRDYYYGCLENDYMYMFIGKYDHHNKFFTFIDNMDEFCRFDSIKLFKLYHTYFMEEERYFFGDMYDFEKLAAENNSYKIAIYCAPFNKYQYLESFTDIECMYKYFQYLLSTGRNTRLCELMNLVIEEKYNFTEKIIDKIQLMYVYRSNDEYISVILNNSPDYLISKYIIHTDIFSKISNMDTIASTWKKVRNLINKGVPIKIFESHKYYPKIKRVFGDIKEQIICELNEYMTKTVACIVCDFIY